MSAITAPTKPLAVHLILQDSGPDAPSRAFATGIYSRLVRGPRPTAIPTRVWAATTDANNGMKLPPSLPLGEAERNVVIVLVDQHLFESRRHWQPYFDILAKALRPVGDVILPVSIFGQAHRVSAAFRDINHVPVTDPDAVASDERVFQAVLTVILRSLLDAPSSGASELAVQGCAETPLPRVFFCHCKVDGSSIARELRGYLYENTQLTGFFDINDIPHGQGVRNAIQCAIAESCVLVIWTDSLLQSRWCQFEILEARSQQRPLLVLDALQTQAPRVFPFLSNMPVVCWSNNPAEVISRLLLELIRTRHIALLFDSLSAQEEIAPRFMLHPPDLMEASSVLRNHGGTTIPPPAAQIVVYPDPPLPAEELAFLGRMFSSLHLHSLSEWTALRAAGVLADSLAANCSHPCPLGRLSIGVSVSSAEGWPSLGLIPEHQDDYIVDIARELILLGARILWGGDLRPEGLGRRLEELVQVYHQADHAPQDHIAAYLAWPNYRKASAKELQQRRAFADVQCLPNPKPKAPESDALDALSFSLMRRQLAADSHARIVLGGKLTGYRGRYPGIVEEALESILSGRALYIVGGFGGASRAVYDAIVAAQSPEVDLTELWQERCMDKVIRAANAHYDELAAAMNLDLRVDHPASLLQFQKYGLSGLCRHNGLSETENARLASSQDIHEIIALLVRGLTNICRCRE